jgi:ABC-type transporter Mla subunit MlaD
MLHRIQVGVVVSALVVVLLFVIAALRGRRTGGW